MLRYIYLDFGWALSPMIETSFFLYIFMGCNLIFVCIPDMEKLRQTK